MKSGEWSREEDDAYQRLLARSEAKERKDQERRHVESIVHREINRRISILIVTAVCVIFFNYFVQWHGFYGIVIWAVGIFGYGVYKNWTYNRTPGADASRAETDAESYVRHCILSDLYQRGELQWELVDGSVTTSDHPQWGTFWKRLEGIIEEFENATPKYRRAKLSEARQRSLRARIAMTDFAKANKSKPLWWATVEPQERLAQRKEYDPGRERVAERGQQLGKQFARWARRAHSKKRAS